jgi:beta-lactamase regulating signal transducer with metallopeptidase domain
MNPELMSWFEFLCRLAIGSTIFPGIGLLAILACRKQSSATRHLVGTLTLIAMFLLPWTLTLLPSWELGILNARSVPTAPTDQRHSESEASANHRNHQVLATETGTENQTRPLMSASIFTPADTTIAVSSVPDQGVIEAEASVTVTSPSASPIDWTTWFLFAICAYLFGVAVGLIRLLIDHRTIWRIISNSEALPATELGSMVSECSNSLSLNRRVEIRLSAEVKVPVVARILRPVILLPNSAMHWPEDRLKAVLAHELAHVCRFDVLIQLASRVVALLYWPQPLVHGLICVMRSEREMACDDLALTCADRRAQYARHLLDVAAGLGRNDRVARAALAMARGSNVERRIAAVLSTTRLRTSPTRMTAGGMLTAMIFFLITATIVSPFSERARASANAQESANRKGDELPQSSKPALTSSDDVPVPVNLITHTLTGRVLLPNGQPAVGAIVRSTDEYRNRSAQATTDVDGRFGIALTVLPRARQHSPLIVRSETGDLFGFVEFPWDIDFAKQSLSRELSDITLKSPKHVKVQVVDEKGVAVDDAAVIVQGGYGVVARSQTNELGEAKLSYPDGVALQTIGAVKAGMGCDYRHFEDTTRVVDKSHPSKLVQGFEGNLKLVLNGIRKASVQVIGPDGQPLADVSLRAATITKPDQGRYWNLSGLSDFTRQTGNDGIAVFDMIPIDNSFGVEFFPRLDRDDWFVIGNWENGNDSALVEWVNGNSATVHIARKVLVGGQVNHPDGRPAAGIEIMAMGDSHELGQFVGTAQSDDQGHWQMLVKPNGYYMFSVKDEELAAKAHAGVIVRESATPMNLNFELQPARRVFGKVTGYVNEQTFVMMQQQSPDYELLPAADRLPNSKNSNRMLFASASRTAHPAADGTFEFKVGPGKFAIWIQRENPQKFTITDELEKEFNFHIDRPQRGAVRISVVKADNPQQRVPNTRIATMAIQEPRFPFIRVTGTNGIIEGERDLVEMLVVAITTDNQFSGTAVLGPDDKDLTVEVSPAIQMTGRLVNSDGQPILESQLLEYNISMKFDGGFTTSSATTSLVVTDAEGRFILEGLCNGLEYNLQLAERSESNASPPRRFLKSFRPDKVNSDLGDIEVQKP